MTQTARTKTTRVVYATTERRGQDRLLSAEWGKASMSTAGYSFERQMLPLEKRGEALRALIADESVGALVLEGDLVEAVAEVCAPWRAQGKSLPAFVWDASTGSAFAKKAREEGGILSRSLSFLAGALVYSPEDLREVRHHLARVGLVDPPRCTEKPLPLAQAIREGVVRVPVYVSNAPTSSQKKLTDLIAEKWAARPPTYRGAALGLRLRVLAGGGGAPEDLGALLASPLAVVLDHGGAPRRVAASTHLALGAVVLDLDDGVGAYQPPPTTGRVDYHRPRPGHHARQSAVDADLQAAVATLALEDVVRVLRESPDRGLPTGLADLSAWQSIEPWWASQLAAILRSGWLRHGAAAPGGGV